MANDVVGRSRELTALIKPANSNSRVITLPDPQQVVKLVAYGVCGGLLQAMQIAMAGGIAPIVDEPTDDVIGADDVAAMLHLDRKTVYDYAGRGVIPCRRIGKRMLFSREAIALWLGSCSGRSSDGNSK
jgi:hypothetical protein